MKKIKLPKNVSRTLNRAMLSGKKHSPEILIVAGVIGTITSTVLACKATTKAGDILDTAKEHIDDIHKVADNQEEYDVVYTEEDMKKDLTIVYAQTGVQLIKLYAPSVIMGTLSVTAILSSHRILTKRNAALVTAYSALDKTFKDYRGRLIDRYGKDVDHQLRYNIKAKEIEETVVNEDGSESTVKKEVNVVDDKSVIGSQYSFFFDETCRGYTKDPEYNKQLLTKMQNYWNDQLQIKGHVYLNDVLRSLGIDETRAGQVVGWVYDKNGTSAGDNYIDFGMFNVYREANRRFVNGYESSVLLNFNVDGVIYDLVK